MPLFDAFCMTIITISTVGFSEIRPLTHLGRLITVTIIVLGISAGTYTIGIIVRWFVEGELSKIFGRRKLQKQISELKNHFIICGFGRIGRIICSELHDANNVFITLTAKGLRPDIFVLARASEEKNEEKKLGQIQI